MRELSPGDLRTCVAGWARADLLLCQSLGCHLYGGCFHKVLGLLLTGEQGFDFAAQGLVILTGRRKESGALAFLTLQGSVKELLDLPPTIRLHAAHPYSARAEAKPWPPSSRAGQSQGKPSAPRRFPPRSTRQKSAVPPLGLFWRPRQPSGSAHCLTPADQRAYPPAPRGFPLAVHGWLGR